MDIKDVVIARAQWGYTSEPPDAVVRWEALPDE
jgi:hypothetical protein